MSTRSKTRKYSEGKGKKADKATWKVSNLSSGQYARLTRISQNDVANATTPALLHPHKDPLTILPNELIELVFGYLCHEANGTNAAHSSKLVNRAWYRVINTNYVYINTFTSTDEDVGKGSDESLMSSIRNRFQRHIVRCGYIRSVKLSIHNYNRMFLKGFFFHLLEVSPPRPFDLIEVNYFGGPFNSEKKGFILTLTESLFGLTCKKLRIRNYSQLIGLNEAEVYHLTTFPGDLELLNWRLKGDADTMVSTLSHKLLLEGEEVERKLTSITPTQEESAVIDAQNRSAITFSCLIQCPELYNIKMKNSGFVMDRATLKWFRDNRHHVNQLHVRKLRSVMFDNVCNVSWFLGMLRSEELQDITIHNCRFGFPLLGNAKCMRNVTSLTLTSCAYEQTNDVDNKPRDGMSSLYDDIEKDITYHPTIFSADLLLSSLPRLERLFIKDSKTFSEPILAIIHKFTIKHVVIE